MGSSFHGEVFLKAGGVHMDTSKRDSLEHVVCVWVTKLFGRYSASAGDYGICFALSVYHTHCCVPHLEPNIGFEIRFRIEK